MAEALMHEVSKHCYQETVHYEKCLAANPTSWLQHCTQEHARLNDCAKKLLPPLEDVTASCSVPLKEYEACLEKNTSAKDTTVPTTNTTNTSSTATNANKNTPTPNGYTPACHASFMKAWSCIETQAKQKLPPASEMDEKLVQWRSKKGDA